MTFSKFGLSETLLKVLHNEEFKTPYPIQEKAIPEVLKGKDVLGIAKTGSGKTASYVLPILTRLNKKQEEKSRQIDALVLVPTRELAEQVKNVFQLFERGLENPVRAMAVYGGVSINPQMKGLYGVSVLVATPGRLLDLVNSNAIQFDKLQTLVLDEADKLLNLGFKYEMKKIFDMLPSRRQNLLFSATLTDKVEEINQMLLKNPAVVNVTPKEPEVEQIKQLAYSIEDLKKGPLLRYIIKEGEMKQVLVFVSSTYMADHVSDKLRKNKVYAEAIHGKKSMEWRRRALKDFKEGRLRVLVATDLLSRGIDIDALPHVINYELPRSPKDFVHRIGRTGRAEANGEAITIVTPEDEHHFKVIQKKMKVRVDRVDANELDLKGY